MSHAPNHALELGASNAYRRVGSALGEAHESLPFGLARTSQVDFRVASSSDGEAIASLHAASWRESYRGAYSDAFLDGDVFDDRRQVWMARLRDPDDGAITVVADAGGVVAGFAHVILEHDPRWGALLDNLHVASSFKRRGVGRLLMSTCAKAVVARAPGSSLFVWVLETNEPAQAFCRQLGGICVGREESEPPGGGRIVGLQFVWRDPSVLHIGPDASAPNIRPDSRSGDRG